MAKDSDINLPPKLKGDLQARTRERRKSRSNEVSIVALAATSRNDLAPELKFELRKLADLKTAKRRSRRTNPEQLKRVIKGMRAFGYSAPMIINAANEIIDGHIVAEAAEHLGLETVQCVIVEHLTPDEERLLRLSLNRLVETGEWNLDELTIELQELSLTGLDLELSGFQLPEISLMLNTAESESEKDEAEPNKPKNPVSQPGDLWLLGEHRLYCGSCEDSSSYEAVLQGEKLHCVFSDPPYNKPIPGVVSGLGKVKHGNFVMGCGEMSDDRFREFLGNYLKLCKAHCSKGAVLFACMDWIQIAILLFAGRDAGLSLINKAVWFKGSGGMGGLYRSAYEEIAVFCTDKTPATNNVQLGAKGRDRMNVWEYAGANRSGSTAGKALGDHPTPKPIELVVDALLDVTKPGDVVLDPFMGSGTTILACDIAKRLARGIEMDPGYVDVAILRWQEATGQPAIHAHRRMTFDQLTAEQAVKKQEPAAGEAAA